MSGELQIFIDEQTATLKQQNQIYIAGGMKPEPIVISPERLKDRIAFLQGMGRLDDSPKQSLINEVMRDLGWKLQAGTGWVELD